ncbi:hypothetical protein [Streptomyces sp. SAI-25]|uniref:hypothetical protein n=1 Tax=Streptomyces sp. SAI-25 TaxID=1472664 RepID=UPI004039E055
MGNDEMLSPDDWADAEIDEGVSEAELELINSEPEYARLPSGSGFLVLGGAEAGSVIAELPADSSKTAKTVKAIKSRDEALGGKQPLYMVQRSAQRYKPIPHLLARLHADFSDHLALGLIGKLPGVTKKSHQDFFDLCPTASVRIVDPVCFLLDEGLLRLQPNPISPRAIKNAPYLSDPEATDWVPSVLAHQREAGANLLLSPGRALDPDTPQKSLDASFAEAEDALAYLYKGERLALNLTVSARWLTSSALRERLFNQLVDQDQFDVVYIRVQWAQDKSFAPPCDASLIDGIKELSNVCMDEERKLILPQTGVTGWLALAFGASGFGIGISSSEQAFSEHAFRRRSPGSTEVERYFEKQLIHTVERATHGTLSKREGYVRCTCPYCVTLHSEPRWLHEVSGYHHLYAVAELTAKVQMDSDRGGRHGAVRRVVKSAQRFANGLPLAGPSIPRHLDAWGQAL